METVEDQYFPEFLPDHDLVPVLALAALLTSSHEGFRDTFLRLAQIQQTLVPLQRTHAITLPPLGESGSDQRFLRQAAIDSFCYS